MLDQAKAIVNYIKIVGMAILMPGKVVQKVEKKKSIIKKQPLKKKKV